MDRQWCPTCAESDAHHESGNWVEIEGHEHALESPRASVYLYEPAHDGQPEKWAAYLPITLAEPVNDSHWHGWREFDTISAAVEYARFIAIREHQRRTATWIECPHWEPGKITLRRGCTACEAERAIWALGDCDDDACGYREPHRHGFACDPVCGCRR